jgi:hypothetical protein
MTLSKQITDFVVKVGIPTAFATILLYYVLTTTATREEKLMNIIKENENIIKTQQTINQENVTLIKDHIGEIREDLKCLLYK